MPRTVAPPSPPACPPRTRQAAIAYARDAEAAGAGALMLLPPLLYGGDEREVLAYFAAVAAGTELPLMVYNNPVASGGTDLLPSFLLRLAEEVDSVVAVKECSGDARRIAALVGGPLEVLVGGDDWPLEGFAAGATGWISGVANVAPVECVALLRHVQDGELDTAREINARMLPLARLDMTPKLVQYFKAAQDAVGRVGGPCRPPRLELTGAGARAARRGARRRCTARRSPLEGGARLRGRRLAHGGHADPRRDGRRRAAPGRVDARAQGRTSRPSSTTCGGC